MIDEARVIIDNIVKQANALEADVTEDENLKKTASNSGSESLAETLRKRAEEMESAPEKNAEEYGVTVVEKKDKPKEEKSPPAADPNSPQEPEEQGPEKATETEFDGPLNVVPKVASDKLVAMISGMKEKHANVLKSVGIPLAAVAVGAGAGFLGGKFHERKKDEVEDRVIANNAMRIGYNAAARAIHQRLMEYSKNGGGDGVQK